jgi:GT2 family glycosyltransferase
VDLTVIILNYNCGDYLAKCLDSIKNSDLNTYKIEVIVVDNHSTDNSFELGKKVGLKNTTFLKLENNLGFSTGNNRGVKLVSPGTRYVLFLNNDTTIESDTFIGMIKYFDEHPNVDAATCYVKLALTGKLQPECHRGFPTPINSFWHFFGFGLPKMFPRSRFLNGYFMGHLDYTKPQKIDCCVGAFLMLKKSVGDKIGWWNEKYFMYGEDLDICYQIKKNNFDLYFIPYFKVTHFQGISSGIKKAKSKATRETKIRSALATTKSMRIFYSENLIHEYPVPLQGIVWLGINLLEKFRVFKARYL